MSVPFITASTIAPPVSPADQTRTGSTSNAFDAALAAEASDESMTAAKAEDLVGTRIRAPEGGCGCDALVAASQPAGDGTATGDAIVTAPPPQSADRFSLAQSTALLSSGSPIASAQFGMSQRQVSPGDVTTGDIVLLRDDADPSGRFHQAIARSATEMIAANRSGLVEVLPIPWRRVAGVR